MKKLVLLLVFLSSALLADNSLEAFKKACDENDASGCG
jgi:hypothetical protein